jgi:hypothetical protein
MPMWTSPVVEVASGITPAARRVGRTDRRML